MESAHTVSDLSEPTHLLRLVDHLQSTRDVVGWDIVKLKLGTLNSEYFHCRRKNNQRELVVLPIKWDSVFYASW